MIIKKNILVIAFSLSLINPLFSQDYKVIAARKIGVENNYANSNVGSIISGKTYNLKYRYAINSQFYNDSPPENGSLLFDGVYFPLIEIQYDLVIQRVIVLLETKSSSRYVSLDSEKVAEFSINESQFTKVQGDSIMANGIYELAYAGEGSKVFIKRIKNKRDKTKDGKNVIFFDKENKYYVQNRFGSFRITNKKSLFYALENYPGSKALIKERRVKLSKKHLEEGLVSAVSLIDQRP